MKKLSYLDRLRLAARWMLPPGEADEVAADYADLLDGDRRTDEALCRDFGRPWKAVGMLRQPKAYRNWMILFCLMAACLFFPTCSIFFGLYNTIGAPFFIQLQFVLLGAAFFFALLGFWRFGAEKQRLTPSFFVLAALLVVLGACAEFTIFAVFTPMFPQWLELLSTDVWLQVAKLLDIFMKLTALFSALTGLWALIQARVSDRRWRALFLLALVVLLAVLYMFRVFRSMEMSYAAPVYIWWNRYMIETALLTVLGLAGTGVLLC